MGIARYTYDSVRITKWQYGFSTCTNVSTIQRFRYLIHPPDLQHLKHRQLRVRFHSVVARGLEKLLKDSMSTSCIRIHLFENGEKGRCDNIAIFINIVNINVLFGIIDMAGFAYYVHGYILLVDIIYTRCCLDTLEASLILHGDRRC